eukprot:Trichotokara_eunicae@DN4185_c0_g1_i1.p1
MSTSSTIKLPVVEPVVPRYKEKFFKTKLCPWNKHGRCDRGDKCQYAHADVEVRSCPSLTKTSLCPLQASSGKCTNVNCRFAHTKDELRSTTDMFKTAVCFAWLRNKCNAGDACRHAHGQVELRRFSGGHGSGSSSSSQTGPRKENRRPQKKKNGSAEKGKEMENLKSGLLHQNGAPQIMSQNGAAIPGLTSQNGAQNGAPPVLDNAPLSESSFCTLPMSIGSPLSVTGSSQEISCSSPHTWSVDDTASPLLTVINPDGGCSYT